MTLPVTFLDSNVAQVMTTFGEYIYDGYLAPAEASRLTRLGPAFCDDVLALRDLAQLGTWYGWPIVVSRAVEFEHARAPEHKAVRLLSWDDELINCYLTDSPDAADTYAFAGATPTDGSEFHFHPVAPWDLPMLRPFPHDDDRRLLFDAISLGCDVFLTMDYRSIWRPAADCPHDLPIRILRPIELSRHARMASGY